MSLPRFVCCFSLESDASLATSMALDYSVARVSTIPKKAWFERKS